MSIQKLNIWAKEADEQMKKLIVDKYPKIIESLKGKDFSDRNIYLKNHFKLVVVGAVGAYLAYLVFFNKKGI